VLQASGVSDRGTVRPTNQDCFAVDEALGLCVVADGMGGHNGGDVAARAAVDTLVTVVSDEAYTRRVGWPYGYDPSLSEAGNLIRTAIQLANTRVFDIAEQRAAYAGMGTTIVAALEVEGRLIVGHIGDSRLYRFTAGRLRQVTGDDSWTAAMIASEPYADRAALAQHPLRHVLTNVVGSRRHAEVHIAEEWLVPEDRLLLTTDGVHSVVDDDRLQAVLAEAPDIAEVPSRLIRTALSKGSDDNCTAVVARYRSGQPESA
jgi:PPM family protein phosphatase